MQAEDITYEWLLENSVANGYTDHVQHFQQLFSLMKAKDRTFLECGCGYSTKYFLDMCKYVTSIEFVNKGYGPGWMEQCQELLKDFPTWTSIISEASDQFYAACNYQMAKHKDYALVDGGAYVAELKAFLQEQLNLKKYSIAFVDPGIYLRGDMVELFLQLGVPVVAAHDQRLNDELASNLYGWHKIKSTGDYEHIHIDKGAGTSFWISKNLKKVIAGMIAYQSQTASK